MCTKPADIDRAASGASKEVARISLLWFCVQCCLVPSAQLTPRRLPPAARHSLPGTGTGTEAPGPGPWAWALAPGAWRWRWRLVVLVPALVPAGAWRTTSCAIIRAKAAILARFEGNNTRRPLLFSACVGMVLVNSTTARKISRREVGGPAQRLQAAVELDGLFTRRRHAASHVTLCRDGGGRFFFSTGPHSSHPKHEAAHAETEAVAEDGRCCMRARCVITEHLTGRRKSPVCGRPRPYIYRVVQPVCRKSDPRP
jgi:hypothetical protein